MSDPMIVICTAPILSGVTSWVREIRRTYRDLKLGDVMVHEIGPAESAEADTRSATIDDARRFIGRLGDAVIVPNYFWGLVGCGAQPGKRIVALCHSDSEDEYYGPLVRDEALIARFGAVSAECRRELARRLPHRSADIELTPYGVRGGEPGVRRAPEGPIRLIYAGRIEQVQKRCYDLAPLVAELYRRGVNFTMDVAGDGSEACGLADALRAVDPAGRVRWHGAVEPGRLRSLWQASDVFVQTSVYEGLSLSMLEAMSFAVVPVVTHASSGIDGVIESGRNGVVVPIADMRQMAGAIQALAADASALREMGRHARAAADVYSIEASARALAALCARAWEGTPAADRPPARRPGRPALRARARAVLKRRLPWSVSREGPNLWPPGPAGRVKMAVWRSRLLRWIRS